MLYPARGMNVNICGKGVRSPASSTRSFLALKQFLKDAASGKIWTQSLTFSRCEIESCSDRTETTPKTSWGLGDFDECKSAHWTASKIPFAPTQFPKTNLSSQTKVSSSHQFFWPDLWEFVRSSETLISTHQLSMKIKRLCLRGCGPPSSGPLLCWQRHESVPAQLVSACRIDCAALWRYYRSGARALLLIKSSLILKKMPKASALYLMVTCYLKQNPGHSCGKRRFGLCVRTQTFSSDRIT